MQETSRSLTLIRRREVEALTGMSRSAIYEKSAAGTFPRAVKIGVRAVGWRLAEVQQWLSNPSAYRAPEAEPEQKPSPAIAALEAARARFK